MRMDYLLNFGNMQLHPMKLQPQVHANHNYKFIVQASICII